MNEVIDITPETIYTGVNLWYQQDISLNLYLYGFFEFKVGVSKKTSEPYCIMQAVSRLNILEFIKGSGFRKRYLPDSNNYVMIQVIDNIMKPVTIDIIRVKAKEELERQTAITVYFESREWPFSIEMMLTTYLKNQDQIFNKNFLELMEEYTVPELKDSRKNSYFLFSNAIIEVNTKTSFPILYNELQNLNKCVWESHIMKREYDPNNVSGQSEFEKFIMNVSNHDKLRINAFKSAIGYLLHNYNGSHLGQAIVCYDEKPTDVRNPQGGTGKGLFAQAFSQMRETAKIDGKHFDAGDKFRFQTVDVTSQIVFIDDMKKETPFEIFFSCLSDGWTIERKHKDTIKLKPEESPKMLFAMNTVILGDGSSHRRRMFILEFSDHYSKKIQTGHEHPIEDEHGILFNRLTWTASHWDTFTAFMIECLSYYLENDLMPYDLINVGANRLIQTTGEDFAEWITEKDFKTGIYYNTKELFEEFKGRYYGADSEYKQRSFTNSLKKFADSKGWKQSVKANNMKVSQFIFDAKC